MAETEDLPKLRQILDYYDGQVGRRKIANEAKVIRADDGRISHVGRY